MTDHAPGGGTLARTVARKEFLEMVRDGRFRGAAAAVGVLLLGGLVSGLVHHRQSTEERAQAERLDREVWLHQGEKSPHSAAHYGTYAFKPRLAIALADRGIEAYVGQAVWLEAHWQNLAQNRPAEDRTALQRFGELTAAQVLQLLVPLLIVLLSFGAFAEERERGTLRQLASLGLSGRTLALGKALGFVLALGLLVVPAALLGALAIVVAATPGGMAPSLARAGLMAAAYVLYFLAVLGVSLTVSAVAPSARVALLGLLAFWMLNGLIVPRVVADLSERLHHTPSATALWAAMREDMTKGIDGHSPSEEREKELEKKVLAEYKVGKVEDLPVSFAGIALQEGEEHGNKVFDKHFGSLWETYDRQERVHFWGALAAPLLAVRSASMGLAGSDFAHHRHFVTAAEEHRRQLQRHLNGEMIQKAKGLDFTYRSGPEFWKTAPEFRYEPPGAVWALQQQAGSLALLGLWAGLAAVAAAAAAARVRPL